MYDDIFERAKQEVDLLSLLSSYGFELRRFPSGYRSNRCPACGPSQNKNSTRLSVIPSENGYWIWHCFCCNKTGDVITALQYLEGFYSPLDAAKWLLGEGEFEKKRRLQPVKSAPPPDEKDVSEKNRARLEVIKNLLTLASTCKGSRKRIWAYFIEQRRIPENIFREAIKKKLVFLLPDEPLVLNNTILSHIPLSRLQKADLLRKGKVKNLILLRPVISPFRQKGGLIGAQFRAVDRDVSPKTVNLVSTGLWWWKGEEKAVCVVEGVIDMLSLVAMGWRGCVLALAGTGLADKAIEVLKGPLRGREVYLALDGDQAGREATRKILSSIKNAHVLQIPDSCDLNDLLKQGVRDWRELLQRRDVSCLIR